VLRGPKVSLKPRFYYLANVSRPVRLAPWPAQRMLGTYKETSARLLLSVSASALCHSIHCSQPPWVSRLLEPHHTRAEILTNFLFRYVDILRLLLLTVILTIIGILNSGNKKLINLNRPSLSWLLGTQYFDNIFNLCMYLTSLLL
jgi:hypothetical protein